jgi:hypothetical protein
MSEVIQLSFLVSLLAGMFRMAAPILYSALGELMSERSGVLNLGIEGMMTLGGFAGYLATYHTGSPWIGLLWAIIAGAAVSALMAVVVVLLKADQTIAGLTINIFASGVSLYLFRITFAGAETENVQTVATFSTLPVPVLSKIPLIGKVLFNQHLLTYLLIILVMLVYWFLYHTKYGLILRTIPWGCFSRCHGRLGWKFSNPGHRRDLHAWHCCRARLDCTGDCYSGQLETCEYLSIRTVVWVPGHISVTGARNRNSFALPDIGISPLCAYHCGAGSRANTVRCADGFR